MGGCENVSRFFLKHVLQLSTQRTKARSVGIYIEKKNASNVIYFLNDYLKETKLI